VLRQPIDGSPVATVTNEEDAVATSGLKTIIYPVDDLAVAKPVYTALLGQPHTDQPYYVGYNAGGQEVGLNPQGRAQGLTGATGFWHVADVKAAVQDLLDAGATVGQEPQDVGGGTVLATVVDPDGNVVGLIQKP
jgi:predicted enzyme related to lactoylglutathione lyase